MALANMNALSVAMNAEQDSTVQALKLQLLQQQLAVERARMTAEDVRGEERLRASAAKTRVILDNTLNGMAAFDAGATKGVSVLLRIATDGLLAASRTVQR